MPRCSQCQDTGTIVTKCTCDHKPWRYMVVAKYNTFQLTKGEEYETVDLLPEGMIQVRDRNGKLITTEESYFE